MTSEFFPPEYFARHDEKDDSLFYEVPRKTVYIDPNAIEPVFLELLPSGGTYLDLMSSWCSHIPEELHPARIIGLGLNAQEMANNKQLDEFVVHDINQKPQVPFHDGQFDAVLCTVSVQYLIKPVEIFCEMNRILKPNGVFVVTFSDRCYPRKTIAIWLVTTTTQRRALIARYFKVTGNWSNVCTKDIVPQSASPNSPSLHIVWARKLSMSAPYRQNI